MNLPLAYRLFRELLSSNPFAVPTHSLSQILIAALPDKISFFNDVPHKEHKHIHCYYYENTKYRIPIFIVYRNNEVSDLYSSNITGHTSTEYGIYMATTLGHSYYLSPLYGELSIQYTNGREALEQGNPYFLPVEYMRHTSSLPSVPIDTVSQPVNELRDCVKELAKILKKYNIDDVEALDRIQNGNDYMDAGLILEFYDVYINYVSNSLSNHKLGRILV